MKHVSFFLATLIIRVGLLGQKWFVVNHVGGLWLNLGFPGPLTSVFLATSFFLLQQYADLRLLRFTFSIPVEITQLFTWGSRKVFIIFLAVCDVI